MVPNQSNILEVWRRAREWPPVTRNFFDREGTVESAFPAIGRLAMSHDDYIGDGLYEMSQDEEFALLPECRNDLEFGYVSGMCGYRRIELISRSSMSGNRLDEDGNIIDSLF